MQKDEGVKIITFCLVGNMVLLALKGTVGLAFGSQALTADAVNSAGDVLSSLVVLLGLRYALKPRDEGHHYGHGKMEALVSLFVGVLILVSTGFLIYDVVMSIVYCEASQPSFFALGAAVLSVIVKGVMYKVTASAGKRLNSIAIMTNARDHLNDIFATSGAVIAIVLSIIGMQFGVDALVLYAEPVIAGVISLFIIKTALEIIIEASRMLLDAAPDKKTVDELRTLITGTEGVIKANWVMCRKMGRGILVDAAVEVDGCIRVSEGHDIGDKVKFAVIARFPEVIDVVVHINPGGFN